LKSIRPNHFSLNRKEIAKIYWKGSLREIQSLDRYEEVFNQMVFLELANKAYPIQPLQGLSWGIVAYYSGSRPTLVGVSGLEVTFAFYGSVSSGFVEISPVIITALNLCWKKLVRFWKSVLKLGSIEGDKKADRWRWRCLKTNPF